MKTGIPNSQRLLLGTITCFFWMMENDRVCGEPSFKDVLISADAPVDEQEDADFPGGNPIEFFDAYSWRLFIALNWPAKEGARGIPDTTKDITDVDSPRVWETWKSPSGLIPPEKNPTNELPNWESFDEVPLCPNEPGPAGNVKTLTFSKLGSVIEDFNQIGDTGFAVGSLVARNRTYIRFEIRMNQKQFEHIRGEKLYLRKALEDRQAHGPPIVFPNQSIEVKAAWREFKLPEEQGLVNRYYHVSARAFNPETKSCETKTFGLVGFHIAQKTARRRQWTWSTFEHVDNLSVSAGSPAGVLPTLQQGTSDNDVTEPDGGISEHNLPKEDPDPTRVRRFVLNPQLDGLPQSSTAATNTKWHNDPRIKNSVWANYQLIIAQWPTQIGQDNGTGSPFPKRNAANVTMETYKQLQQSSCIQCHFPTPLKTDFVWFLSLRAFPLPQPTLATPTPSPGILGFFKRLMRLEAASPSPAPPGGKVFLEKLRASATKAQEQ